MTDVPLSKLILLSIAASAFLLWGCSESDPELTSSKTSVVFDYKTEGKVPEVKLAAFLEVYSDVHRSETFTLKSKNPEFQWNCASPMIFSGDKRSWCGYSEFAAPQGMNFPVGIYELEYVDAQGKSISTTSSVYYDEKLLKVDSTKIEARLTEHKKTQIALYSDKGSVVYFGIKKQNWSDDRKIFTSYRDAAYYRMVYIEAGDTLTVLMPPVYKKNIENQTVSSESAKK